MTVADAPAADERAALRRSGSDEEARALHEANALLRRIGFGVRQFARFEDLVASASSMSVALYEKLFQLRLESVERAPRSLAHYEANAQRVLDALSAALLEAPPPGDDDDGDDDVAFDSVGVTGAALCAGDARAIRQVVRMFEHVLSLLAGASIAPLPARARKKGAARRSRKLRTSRSPQQPRRRASVSDSGSESDSERGPRRSTRRATQHEHFAQSDDGASTQRGDANLYEVSDASIRRTRTADIASRRAQQRSDADASDQLRDAGPRKLSEPLAAVARRSRGAGEQQTRASGPSSKGSSAARTRRSQADASDASLLLATQKYDRFVPVAASRSRVSSSQRGSHGASGVEVAGGGADDPVRDKEAAGVLGGEPMYFGGVSSVSSGSRSDESVHFLEEDDDASRDFSSNNVVDLQNVPPRNSLSPSNAYDEPRRDDRSTGAPTTSKSAAHPSRRPRKPNQEAEEEDATAEVASEPANKQPSRKPAVKSAPVHRPPGARVRRERDPASSLYPLLPKKSAATSKSQAEYTRYKLFLKDHLQDLRQREFCQRQHLERAYKVGEHSANVEKIRARRFQQDIRLQRIAIGLEAKNEEEKHLRHTLTHILELEKAKLRDEHRTTSSILQQIQKDHVEREVAVEAFYAHQIELVKERTHREVRERELVQKAHRLASEQMLREMRREREHQVSALLQEKQHLEEARRFRAAATLSSALERGDDARARASQARVDAFYTAAMKARQHNAARRGGGVAGATSAPRNAASKQPAATYASIGRPVPVTRRAR